jgi:hypothetical protein
MGLRQTNDLCPGAEDGGPAPSGRKTSGVAMKKEPRPYNCHVFVCTNNRHGEQHVDGKRAPRILKRR